MKNNNNNCYSHFARYYDILTTNIPYQKRGEYFHSLIKRYTNKTGSLLDLACGTGSLSGVMAKLGYDVIGVDISADMLAIASNKKYESNLDILYLCQDIAKLKLHNKVDVCISALDSLNHICQIKILQLVFNRVAKHLNKDGVFIFDLNTVYKHQNILANNTFVYDMQEVFCVWQNTLKKDHTVEINLDFFAKKDDNIYNRYSEQFCERAYTHEEIIEIIKKSGLELIDFFQEDSFEKPKANTERIVYITKLKA